MEKLTIDATKELLELKKFLHDRQCRPSDALERVREILEENDLNNEYPELWNNWKTYEELEDLLKEAIESGINRVYYFLGDANIYDVEIMYVDNYGNCDTQLSYGDLIEVIDGIIDDYGADADIY